MFDKWFAEVMEAPIYVAQPGDARCEEARSNLWAFGLPDGGTTNQDEIVAFLHAVVQARQEQLIAHYGYDHPMTFYAWVDEQAGQLRFSLETAEPAALCFGCTVGLVNNPEDIAEEFLKSSYLHGIPFDELTPTSWDMEETGKPLQELPLPVWAVRLGERTGPSAI